MVFVAKPLRYDTPPEILDHLVRVWRVGVPFDKDLLIINPQTLKVRRVEGDFYAGRITGLPVP
jgi:hypothetical protein